ncbi:MAG: cupin domain-containing protein [Spirochaetes bacterium]|nr:MAG: cupin domain-containing protein [Spirochaetota bacterium]
MESHEFTREGLAVRELVNYQDGSVVSKTIINKQSGTLTLFAFDKGEKLSEHTAPFDAVVHVLDGSAKITIEGTPYTVREGEFILMPAGKPHALEAVAPFKMMLIMIKGS